ncbi:hypothetical protein GCM10009601_51110 [Streptomyces thermospinosisporus]|uniref:Uncharacterized protein n=2 Tax=Streptomyces thermospinosisporus TaxID=161482 RepID=A0ABN1Z4V5_9ACTN
MMPAASPSEWLAAAGVGVGVFGAFVALPVLALADKDQPVRLTLVPVRATAEAVAQAAAWARFQAAVLLLAWAGLVAPKEVAR